MNKEVKPPAAPNQPLKCEFKIDVDLIEEKRTYWKKLADPLVIATFLLFVATFALYWTAFHETTTSQEISKVTANSLKLEMLPILNMTSISFSNIGPNDSLKCTFTLVNVGRTPAFVQRVVYSLQILPVIDLSTHLIVTNDSSTAAIGRYVFSGLQETTVQSARYNLISNSEYSAMAKDSMRLYLFGTVYYVIPVTNKAGNFQFIYEYKAFPRPTLMDTKLTDSNLLIDSTKN